MTDNFSWTATFGRWWGVALQIHLFFLLFAAVVFCVEWHYLQNPGRLAGTGLATVMVVLVAALGHELAHGFAASTLGGRLRELVITPWGGQSDLLMPLLPREQILVHIAGPFFNLASFGIAALLLITSGHETFGRLIDPLRPFPLQAGLLEISLVKIFAWVNFQMLVVNLIPAYPFDASRTIRSSVMAYNSRTPALKLENAILGMGIGCGLLMFLLAFLCRDINYGEIQPTWFVLVVAGLALIFSARFGYHVKVVQAEQELELLDNYIGYEMMDDEFESSDAWMSDYEEDVIADWLNDQQPRREIAEQSVAIDEETRVDAILKKVHELGAEALTEDEREFMNRISQQYRRRKGLRS